MKTAVKRQTRKVGVAGGFINQMMGNNATQPEVGKGATILSYSDRHAYEVTEVAEDGLSCVIREMDTKNIGEAYGDERYEYASNEENHTYNLRWNEKRACWGKVGSSVQIIKALAKKLDKQYGFGWTKFLPNGVDYSDLFIKENEDNFYNQMKVVKGITKEYKNFEKISIIFGVMEQYRDPSF